MTRRAWIVILLLAGIGITARLARRPPLADSTPVPSETPADVPAPASGPASSRVIPGSSRLSRSTTTATSEPSQVGAPAEPVDIPARIAELEAEAYAKAPYLKYCEENRNAALDQLAARFPSGTQSYEALLASTNPAVLAQRRQLGELLKRLEEPVGARAVLTNSMLAAIQQELMEDRPEILARDAAAATARMAGLRELGVAVPGPELDRFQATPTYSAWMDLVRATAEPAMARIEALVGQQDVGRQLLEYLTLESYSQRHTVLCDTYIDTHTPPELQRLRLEARQRPGAGTPP